MPLSALRAPLRHALFRRFFAGQAVSQLGDAVFHVALPWQVLVMTGSTIALGGIFATLMASQIAFLLVGGAIVDRFPRRTIVVMSDVLQGIFAASLALLVFAGWTEEWHIYVLAGLFGASQAFAMPALNAFIPETVPREAIQGANSLFQGTRTLTFVAGPSLGAGIIALAGTSYAFAFDAVTFAVSATLLASVRPSGVTQGESRIETESVLGAIRAGARYVRKVPWVWIAIVLFSVLNAAEAGPRNVVLPAFVGIDLRGGPTGIGLVLSAAGVGAFLGFFLANALPATRRRGVVVYGATAIFGGITILIGLAPSIPVIVGLSIGQGICFALVGLLWQTSINEFVPVRMQGRVFSIDMFGSFALLPVSMAASGALAAAFGPRIVFMLGGATVVGCSAIGLLHPRARRFERPAE